MPRAGKIQWQRIWQLMQKVCVREWKVNRDLFWRYEARPIAVLLTMLGTLKLLLFAALSLLICLEIGTGHVPFNLMAVTVVTGAFGVGQIYLARYIWRRQQQRQQEARV